MLAVHCDPLLGRDACRDPERRTEQPGHCWMKYERSMGGRPMKEDGGAEHGDLDEQSGSDKTDDQGQKHTRVLQKKRELSQKNAKCSTVIRASARTNA